MSDADAASSPHAAVDSMPLEEQLKKLQEKTAAWKKAVAAQLDDAAKKNKILREALEKAAREKDDALAKLRVEMNREYKERTVMKDEEVKQLHDKLSELYAEQKKVAADHLSDIARAEQRARETCLVEAAQSQQKAVGELHQTLIAAQAQVSAKESELAHEKSTVSTLTTRLERLGNQYRELSSLIHRRSADTSADTGHKGGAEDEKDQSPLSTSLVVASPDKVVVKEGAQTVLATLHDGEHQHQIDQVQEEMRERERDVQRQLDALRREHDLQTTNLVRELHRRDEHATMLQTLQRQLQQDLLNAQVRISTVQEEKAAVEQRFSAKVAALSKELAECMEAQARAQQIHSTLLEQQTASAARIEELEAEAASREESFRALMLSDSDRGLVRDLQGELHRARAEADAYKARWEDAIAASDDGSGRRAASDARGGGGAGGAGVSAVSDGSVGSSENAGHVSWEVKAAQLQQREEALKSEQAALEQQREAQRATEAKLDALRRTLAAQANQLFRNSQDDDGSAEDDGGDNSNTNSGGIWRMRGESHDGSGTNKRHVRGGGGGGGAASGGHSSTKATTTRRAPLSFDTAASATASGARRGWVGTTGSFLGWIPSRLRLIIPILLFLLLFLTILNMR